MRSALRPMLVVPVLAAGVGCVPVLVTEDTGDTGDCPSWTAPTNDWPTATPPACLEGQGFSAGEVIPDFRLPDQRGQTVSLWQFFGDVVLVDISTMWCGPCRELAYETQATYEDYADSGFMYVTILAEDNDGQPPDTDDLVTWADYYGIEAPIVGDGDKAFSGQVVFDGTYPRLLLVDRELRVIEEVDANDQAVRAAIEAAL